MVFNMKLGIRQEAINWDKEESVMEVTGRWRSHRKAGNKGKWTMTCGDSMNKLFTNMKDYIFHDIVK